MGETKAEKPILKVKLFGGCSLFLGENTIGDDENRSKKAWGVLCYLLINRGRLVSSKELFDAVWQEEEQDNPTGALKTLVFRVRRMLDAAGFPSQDLILSRRGGYTWNPDFEMDLDTERFETLCAAALDENRKMEEAERVCREAFDLYEGVFLPKMAKEPWAAPLCEHYREMYRKLVSRMALFYQQREEYGQMFHICSTAASIERFCEEFQYYRILALFSSGRRAEAMEQYQSVTQMFYREQLATPSENFKELYKIISCSEQEVVTDLARIQEKLEDQEPARKGAYQCEYAVFKRLYQLERRSVGRSGDSVYLCLITVGNQQGRNLKPEIQARAMERLQGAIEDSLRASDVYVRYSVSQYILLLPSTSYENGERVMSRILSAFSKAYVRKDVSVSYSLNAVLPVKEEDPDFVI